MQEQALDRIAVACGTLKEANDHDKAEALLDFLKETFGEAAEGPLRLAEQST